MLKYRGKKPLIIFLLFLFISVAIFIPVIYSLSDRLSKTARVDANILLVEGWLPSYAIKMAYEEFQKHDYEYIVTTGLKHKRKYLMMAENGYLIFYTKDKFAIGNKTDSHLIEIDSYSELEEENSSHFNVWINDSMIADFYADRIKKKYSINWKGYLSDIDSVMVQFTNDDIGAFGDRNLYIKSIIVDNRIEIPYLLNSVYDIDKLDKERRSSNNMVSNTERTKNELISLGIDPNLIIAIPGNRAGINRTLASALAFRNWLKTNNLEIEGINIISLGAHGRRTWTTFNKVLDKSFKIGIISLPDYENQNSRKGTILKTLRETIGLIYYWIILIPY